MANRIITALPRTKFTFTVAQFPSSQSITVPVALNIETGDGKELIMICRVHEAPTWSEDAEIVFKLYPAGPTEEDPGKLFRSPSAYITVTITEDEVETATTFVDTNNVTSGVSVYNDLLITFTQPGSAGTYSITVSVDLIVKQN